MRALQGKSTKMIGDINLGIGARLVQAKAEEKELAESRNREKVLEDEVKDLVDMCDEQTVELAKVKEDAKAKIN